MFLLWSTLGNTWIFAKDLGLGHVNAVELPEPKSVEIILRACQIVVPLTFSLKTWWSSTIVGELSTMRADSYTKVKFDDGAKVEVNEVEIVD